MAAVAAQLNGLPVELERNDENVDVEIKAQRSDHTQPHLLTSFQSVSLDLLESESETTETLFKNIKTDKKRF